MGNAQPMGVLVPAGLLYTPRGDLGQKRQPHKPLFTPHGWLDPRSNQQSRIFPGRDLWLGGGGQDRGVCPQPGPGLLESLETSSCP